MLRIPGRLSKQRHESKFSIKKQAVILSKAKDLQLYFNELLTHHT